MHLGGAERSLIGLLNTIDYSKVDVDLFLNRHEGALMKDIPSQVHLLPENKKYASLSEPMSRTLKHGHFLIVLSRLAAKLFTAIKCPRSSRLGGGTTYSSKFTKWLMPKLQKNVKYDLAISYMTPHYFVTEKITAKTKIAWIHQDYGKGVFDVETNLRMWAAYDKIVSISDAVTEGFIKCFPSLQSKIIQVPNFIPVDLIKKEADEKMAFPFKDGEINILSVGRFCWEKNFSAIPSICVELRKRNIKCNWYIIGFGSLEKEIENAIIREKMVDNVFLLGKQTNPYPYIKNCTIYVQPSISEGKAVTVTEAQILGKPVIITNYPTAHSQLRDGIDGIVAPLDILGCADMIAALLTDKEKMRVLENNCTKTDYSGKENIDFLLEL